MMHHIPPYMMAPSIASPAPQRHEDDVGDESTENDRIPLPLNLIAVVISYVC